MDWLLFCISFFLAALTPGLNMLTALAIGLSLGYRKAFLYILTSTFSIAAIVFLSGVGIGFLIVKFPAFFDILKICGSIYLFFISYKMWRVKNIDNSSIKANTFGLRAIIFQGFVGSFGDPIIWGFMISLLPKFMDINNPFNLTFVAFIIIISLIEFIATNIYAIGGWGVKKFFISNLLLMNKISGVMFFLLGLWMIYDVIKALI